MDFAKLALFFFLTGIAIEIINTIISLTSDKWDKKFKRIFGKVAISFLRFSVICVLVIIFDFDITK